MEVIADNDPYVIGVVGSSKGWMVVTGTAHEWTGKTPREGVALESAKADKQSSVAEG